MGEYLGAKCNTATTNGDFRTDQNMSSTQFTSVQKRSMLCMGLLQLIARSFIVLEPLEKEQIIHFARKMLPSWHNATSNGSDADLHRTIT
jgi:hypothetical protein